MKPLIISCLLLSLLSAQINQTKEELKVAVILDSNKPPIIMKLSEAEKLFEETKDEKLKAALFLAINTRSHHCQYNEDVIELPRFEGEIAKCASKTDSIK